MFIIKLINKQFLYNEAILVFNYFLLTDSKRTQVASFDTSRLTGGFLQKKTIKSINIVNKLVLDA